ncbi:MAG: hypothetical protein CBC62_02060 [Opitutia bacterium TMED102]|nr:MAG: hypothetical protein CBC62_02060 [Opitutae bacterium TMED102]
MAVQLTKRAFIKSTGFASLGLSLSGLSAAQAKLIKRKGQPRLNLSLAAYSFRDYFNTATHQQNRPADAKEITMHDFIDYCADQGLAGAELTSYYLDQNISKTELLNLKRHAFLRGVAISGTAVGNTFTFGKGGKRDNQVAHVKKWVDNAAIMGAPHVRVFAGNANGLPLDEAQKNCIECLEEVGDYAGQRGVFLGIENHGGIVAEAESLLKIVEGTQSKWVGINLDTGNFHTNDVYGDLERCVPYSVNVQLKVEIRPSGSKNKSLADIDRLIRILRDGSYQGFVALEYEAAANPWKAVPEWLVKLRKAVNG